MPIQRTEALVLKRYDFRETSLIVHFYTRDFGKLSGILKGIRQEPQKFSSTLEPFSYNEIIFYKKRSSGLHLVSQCDLKDNFNHIRANILKVGAANLIIELVDNLMQEEDKNEDVFDLTIVGLRELETNNNPDKITTLFKIKLLDLSGFRPHLSSCVSCGIRIIGEAKFSLSLGGLLCAGCYKKDPKARSIYRGTVASILHIQKNEFKNNLTLGMNPQIKKELDLILNSFINFHLEKELKSEKVINKLKKLEPV